MLFMVIERFRKRGWNDLIDFEIVVVVMSAQTREVMRPHL